MSKRNAFIFLVIVLVVLNFGVIWAYYFGKSEKKSSVRIADCSAEVRTSHKDTELLSAADGRETTPVLDMNVQAVDLVVYGNATEGFEIKLAVDNIAVADCNYAHFIKVLGEVSGAKDVNNFCIRFLDGDLTKEGFERR